METSEELRRVVTRFIEAVRDGDGEAIRNRVSLDPGVERFGSDADEVWHGGDTSIRLWIRQMQEMGGGYPWRLIDVVYAMSEGSVGWAGGRAMMTAPITGSVEFRFTCVLHLEHGEWKIVQWHSSVPTPNEEHGFFLTKSVDQIVEAVTESRPDLTASSGPDGTVTIAFTDIEDSMKLNSLVGDRRWLDILHAHNEVVTSVTDEHGGSIVKGQGDGFMLAFASARRAIACARGIQQGIAVRFDDPGSPIRVRIGLHVGETINEADDFFGHAVAYAARIASKASGGEVVVSALVHALVAPTGEFRFDDPREIELKGVEGPQKIYPLVLEPADVGS